MCSCTPDKRTPWCEFCPEPPKEPACRHSFSFLRYVQEKLAGPGQWTYVRTDHFFCSSCLEERTKTVHARGYQPPAWWNQ